VTSLQNDLPFSPLKGNSCKEEGNFTKKVGRIDKKGGSFSKKVGRICKKVYHLTAGRVTFVKR
jgi:hypothetical protein